MGGGSSIWRVLFAVFMFVGLICFLYAGVLGNHATSLMTGITVPSTGTIEHLKLVGRDKHTIYQDLDLHYVSKRRVPNGPDPIHNRRASQSRQPPGRS